jgi:DNA-binding transcriptional ArsR family regulator
VRKLGDALKQVVAEGYEAEEGGAAKSVLMHPNRRRAFEYVAWHPCCTAGDVARALGVRDPTAAWHLAKLAEAGYTQEVRLARGRVHHAAGLGLEPPDVAGLAALAEADAPRALALVLTTPGLTGAELAAKLERHTLRGPLRAMLASGLVVAVADGRYRRYYPGSVVAAIERTAPKRLRDFRRRLVRKLERDRLAPEMRIAPGGAVEIDVRFGDERATLRLPAESLLAGRLA